MTAYAQVLDLLDELSANELASVQALITQMRGTGKVTYSKNRQEAYHCLNYAAEKVGVMMAPASAVTRTPEYKRLSQAADSVLPWVYEAFRAKDEQENRVALMEACICLVTFMQKQHIPLSTTSILRQFRNLPAAVEDCYPGYARAGLLRQLLRVRGETQLTR